MTERAAGARDIADGRTQQKMRTRKHLLETAARMLKQGRNPTLDEVAEEAFVSRATAYRYFPNVEALLVEASLDVGIPEPAAVFADDASTDLIARLQRADDALHEASLANEATLRRMLIHSLQLTLSGADAPPRQNRRTPMIDAALAGSADRFKPSDRLMLRRALALVFGPEAILVCKDVLGLSDADTRKVKRWAIRAMVEAALKEG